MLNRPGSKNSTLFKLDKVTIAWPGHTVLHEISLTIKHGEKLAILGRSGSGKSSLLNHLYQLNSLAPLDSLEPVDNLEQGMAFCQQNPGLVPSLSAFHNIFMGQLEKHHFLYNAINLFFPFKEALADVGALAERVGLADKLMEKAETLSGGQQQRVALARCLYQKRAVFLGDEPVSAVDETQADDLLSLIMSAHQTVIMALHNTQQALRHCDRIIGLHGGAIVLDAPSKALTQNDLSEFYSETSYSASAKSFGAPLMSCQNLSSAG